MAHEKEDALSKEIENAGSEPAFYSPQEEKALIRKIDLVLMPMMWLMYLLSYLDRTNIGNAKISGMETDLDLSSNEYSISLVVFFIGYVVFEVPSNLLLSRIRPSLFLSGIMALWGTLTCVMAAIKNFKHLVVLRAIIGKLTRFLPVLYHKTDNTITGCVEAGFAPGVLMVIASWYKQTEQSKRFGIYITAAVLSGAFGGLIAAGIIQGLEGSHGLRGWRWLFIVEGAATIGVAFIAAFILPDFPATSKGFSERERSIAVARLSDDITAMTVDSEQLSPWRAIAESVKEWRTWMFVIGYMVIVGSSTLTYFYPTLVAGLFGNASTQRTNLLTVPIYAAAFVCTIITAWVSDKVPSWRGLIIAGWLAFSLACSIAVCTVYDYTARYALLVLMASGLWTTNGGTLAYASSSFGNMHPQTRGVSLALVNALGNLAQIYGSYLFPDSDSPKYIMGFSVISAMLAVGVVVFLALHVWFRRRASSASATD